MAPITLKSPLMTEPDETLAITHEFLEMARRAGDRTAVVDTRRSLTYEQIESRSRLLSDVILAVCDVRSRVVAIHGHRNAGLVVALLGVSRAGLTFSVLDAAYPRERLRQMVAAIHPDLIIGDDETDPNWREVFGERATPYLSIDSGGVPISGQAAGPTLACTDERTRAEFAYLLFTSGTTGTPRCIATRHAPLRHFIFWYTETFRPGPGDRFSLLSGLGHDPMLRDIFVPLAVGAQIHIPPQAIITQPRLLFDWLRASGITFLHATPPMLRLIGAGSQEKDLSAGDLRYIFSGGDTLTRELADEIFRFAPVSQLVNFYGTTETPQAVICHVVRHDESAIIPIGRGIRDVQVFILKENQTLADVGEWGQISIRTRFLSAGYCGDSDATAQRFIPSPFTADPTDLIYLTGDIGYMREDGEVVIRGRCDDQVKIRGFRVELMEINRVIKSLPEVRDVVTLAHTAATGEKVLVAYVATAVKDRDAMHAAINQLLREQLPAYMVPSRLIGMDRLPLLPNNKVDRQALAAIWQAQQDVIGRAAADTDDRPEAKLVHAWRKILGVVDLDRGKSFAELGGDSISFIEASLAVRKTLGWLPDDWSRIPLAELSGRQRVSARRAWCLIDSTILVRALSIICIVLGHITPYELSGTVVALFILAGWSFANFQFRAVLQQDSVRPILRFMLRLVVPTVLAVAWQNWDHFVDRWWAFCMLSNYFPVYPYRVAGFWFLDVLVQMFAILAILFASRTVRRAAVLRPFPFAFAATLAAITVGLAIHWVWDTKPIYDYVPHMYLWLVFYGMAMAYADTWRRKLLLAALLLGSACVHHIPVFALVVALGILVARRLYVPVFAAPIIAAIASASLFIYVTHDKLGALLYGRILGVHVTYETLGALQFHSVTGLRGVVLTAVLVAAGVGIGALYNQIKASVMQVHRRLIGVLSRERNSGGAQ